MSLSIQTGAVGPCAYVVALRGEVDYESARELREAVTALLSTGTTASITVDLGAVTFMDSTGVGTLVVARRICGDVGVRFTVTRPSPFLARLLGGLGVAEVLGVRVPAPRARSGDPLPQSA